MIELERLKNCINFVSLSLLIILPMKTSSLALIQNGQKQLAVMEIPVKKQVYLLLARMRISLTMSIQLPKILTRFPPVNIEQLEKEKLIREVSLQKSELPQGRFEEMFGLAMQFLVNSLKLWQPG